MPPATDVPYRSVICAVDFSGDSRAALLYASRVARRADGVLTAVFVNDPLLAKAAVINFDGATVAKSTERDLRTFVVQALGAEQAQGVKTVVAMGDAADEIKKIAKKLKANLIAVGTRGLGGAGKLFFGSTTSRILRITDLPVLAVPAAGLKGRKGPGDSWPANILAAVKLDDHAALDARAALAVADRFGAPLTLASVLPPLHLPASLMRGGAAGERARLAEARAKLGALTARLKRTDVQTRTLAGDPAEQISLTALDIDADLIVLALRSEKGMLGARQGTVTYRVLSTAQRPVLALVLPVRKNR